MGYWIDRACWGRGIATEALSAFLRLNKRDRCTPVWREQNAASIRVLQKCVIHITWPRGRRFR